MKHVLFVCGLVVLAGCSQRSVKHDHSKQWTETEARLYDIPVPHGAIPDYTYNNDSSGIAYRCSMNLDELTSWYCQQLDVFGWQYSMHTMGPEVLIRAKKPKKWCSISIRPSTTSLYHVVIFTSSRSSYHKEL